MDLLERHFKLRAKGTDVRTEIIAGVTTFVTMAYIIFVNPTIMADAGMPREGAIAATIWISVLSTFAMGVIANYPVALAPALGVNAFFAYYVCGILGLHWTVALGAMFFSGIVFLFLTISGLRQAIIDCVPMNLKLAISVGIGLFIAFIGLKGAGIIVENSATFITLGSISTPSTALALFGLLFTGAMMVLNVKGAILIGIIATSVLSMILGYSPSPHSISDIVSTSFPSLTAFGELDIAGAWDYGIISIIFTFTIVELFDNIGTLIGVAQKADLIDENGKIENINTALTIDAVGTIGSSIIGTSTVSSYIESASGIATGGRTGLTAVVVSVLFMISLFFAPLIGFVPAFATAPALILVGALMMDSVKRIAFEDFTDGFPAFLTIIMMPMTSSIANGFAFGFVSHVFMKTIKGKAREIHPLMWAVSIAFMINLIMRS